MLGRENMSMPLGLGTSDLFSPLRLHFRKFQVILKNCLLGELSARPLSRASTNRPSKSNNKAKNPLNLLGLSDGDGLTKLACWVVDFLPPEFGEYSDR